MQFDLSALTQLFGLGGITLIISVVKALELKWGWAKVVAAMAVGVIINVAIAFAFDNSWREALGVGIVTGLASNVYYDYKSRYTAN
jgi:hypothetical protein